MSFAAESNSPPDLHHCASDYGSNLNNQQCIAAAAQLPIGSNPVEYQVRGKLLTGQNGSVYIEAGSIAEPYVLPWSGAIGQ